MTTRRLRLPTVTPQALFYLLVAVLASAPAWIVKHPPIQDLPFHMATLRIIHDHGNSAFGFESVYRLNLFGTEYLLYYLVGHVLAFFMGVKAATVALMCVYLGGTPLALRAFLRACGRDERLCIFVVPLVVNVMFCFGLLPFVFGFPLMFWALTAAVRHFERPTRKTGLVLGVLTVLTFFAHILPFAIFGVGCIGLFPWSRPRRWVPASAPLALGLGLVGWWGLGSKAGGSAFASIKDQTPFAPFDSAIAQFPKWSTNVFLDQSDEFWALALGAVALAALGLSAGDRDESHPIARRWFLVPLACGVAYLSLGAGLGDVWLFAQRFAVPALFTCIPLLRMPRGGRGVAVTAAAVVVSVGAIVNVCKHFIAFERDEVGDIQGAIDSMGAAKHVAGLIYDKRSALMQDEYATFLHFVSYYQVEKGGVVQFAYTGFPHWPVQYEPGMIPPPGKMPRLRWEWTPELVPITELYPYYDCILTRGQGFSPPPGTFHVTYRDNKWTVWTRD